MLHVESNELWWLCPAMSGWADNFYQIRTAHLIYCYVAKYVCFNTAKHPVHFSLCAGIFAFLSLFRFLLHFVTCKIRNYGWQWKTTPTHATTSSAISRHNFSCFHSFFNLIMVRLRVCVCVYQFSGHNQCTEHFLLAVTYTIEQQKSS